MIKVENGTKNFKKVTALNNFNAEFSSGVYGLLGANGSGKTTLMRCICKILELSDGKITINTENVGYLPQAFGMFKQLKLYEMMEYFCVIKKVPKEKRKEEIKRCLEYVNLTDKAKSRVGALSGGMVRRAGIAQAILGDPDVIIFDEPTTGLDPEERMRFKNLIKNISKNKTIIISTHIVSDVEAICDHILIIDKGKDVYMGTQQEIIALAKEKVYKVLDTYESNLKGNYYIKDRKIDDNSSYLYILSSENQKGEILNPTVEDGYLCAIKNI